MSKTIALAAAYLLSIVAAAYAITHIGTQYAPGAPHVLPIWFGGIEAPSGVYVVGVTLVLRDLLQHRITRRTMLALIVAGAALSALVSPTVALASGVAFLASESVDWAVFTATEKRAGFLAAVLSSNAVSLIVDSVVFLLIGFGSLAFLEGQVIGKALATVAAVLILAAIRARRTRAVTA